MGSVYRPKYSVGRHAGRSRLSRG